MPNPLYTYILNTYMICKRILYITFSNEQSSFLHTVKWFQILLYNSHDLTSVICLHTVCSIWPIDRTLSGATNLGQGGPGRDGNEEVLHIPQICKAGASPSNGLMSYWRHSLVGILPFCKNAVSIFYSASIWAILHLRN